MQLLTVSVVHKDMVFCFSLFHLINPLFIYKKNAVDVTRHSFILYRKNRFDFFYYTYIIGYSFVVNYSFECQITAFNQSFITTVVKKLEKSIKLLTRLHCLTVFQNTRTYNIVREVMQNKNTKLYIPLCELLCYY